MASANEMSDRKFFDVPKLKVVIAEYKQYMEE
jgi:hypothetical protein